MRCNSNAALASVLFWALKVDAQLTKWLPNQVNTTICYWDSFGAALVNGTVYLDGGISRWTRGGNDGTQLSPVLDRNERGFILSYDLGASFYSDTNTTGILVKNKSNLEKRTVTGTSFASESGLNFRGGALLGNDDQFYIYGGTSWWGDRIYRQPERDATLAFYASPYNMNPRAFERGFFQAETNNNVDRYIADGAAVNVPSENKAFYFSGLKSPSGGPIYTNTDTDNNTFKAEKVANTLITLDMKSPRSPNWTTAAIQNDQVKIKGRAGAELVWVPIGKEGILVVLGGVIAPEWIEFSRMSSDPEKSEEESPVFMQTIDIYDVEGKKWYQQPTQNGPPGQRAKGCAVVAYPSDHSSFNIYYYGGYDGLYADQDASFYDDVWVLSLPSFTWVQLDRGNPDHSRAGHRCFKPYADQMMVFGGFPPVRDNICLQDGPVLNFDLTSGEWKDSYDPAKFGDYRVPERVLTAIGGKKSPEQWSSALSDLFNTRYDYSKLPTYTAYPSVDPPQNRPDVPKKKDDKGGSPSWLAPVLGVVLGLVLLTAVIVLFCLYRKRMFIFRRRAGPSEPGTEEVGRMRIYNWVRYQQTPQPIDKAPTVTSEEMPATASEMAHHPHHHPAAPYSVSSYNRNAYNTSPGAPQEMYAETAHAFELPDTPQIAELGGFVQHNTSRSQSKRGASGVQSWSAPSSNVGANSDFNDTVSQASGPTVEPGLVDSPTLARSPAEASDGKTRCTSDVSMITNHTSHLRNTSNATVSSEGTHVEQRNAPVVQSIAQRFEAQEPQHATAPQADVPEGPVSPPTSDEVNGNDYFPPLVSPIAKPAVLDGDGQHGRK
jgi:hypothetical protein